MQSILSQFDSAREIALSDPETYCRYRNGITDYYSLKAQENAEVFKPKVIWICGPSGCGKTRSAKEAFPDAWVCTCIKGMKWFQGYNLHEEVIFDEFRYDTLEWQLLLQLTHENAGIMVEVKYGQSFFHPKMIIFTSPQPPEEEFSYGFGESKKLRDDYRQFERRIDEIHEFRDGQWFKRTVVTPEKPWKRNPFV